VQCHDYFCLLSFQIFQLLYQFKEYFRWENLLEWGAYLTSLVYVAVEFRESESFGIQKYVEVVILHVMMMMMMMMAMMTAMMMVMLMVVVLLVIILIFSFLFCFRCSDWHPSIGAVAIFAAWMCLLLFIRKFPKLGIYVVMFTDILYTFIKFSLIFILFIVAFALSFYTLLADKVQLFDNLLMQ